MLVMDDGCRDSSLCCTESQPSPLETQPKTQSRRKHSSQKSSPRRVGSSRNSSFSSSNGNRKSETENESQQLKREFDESQKGSKRKINHKLPASKRTSSTSNHVFPSKSSIVPTRTSHNNNSNAVLNRNSLLKVKKLLRSRKTRC